MNTLTELRNNAIEELEEWMDDNFEEGYLPEPHDIIHEIADTNVPVYTSDLMELAARNINLAVDEPELGPAFDGSPTPVNIVAANVFEYLEQELWEAFEENKQELIRQYEDNLEDEDEN